MGNLINGSKFGALSSQISGADKLSKKPAPPQADTIQKQPAPPSAPKPEKDSFSSRMGLMGAGKAAATVPLDGDKKLGSTTPYKQWAKARDGKDIGYQKMDTRVTTTDKTGKKTSQSLAAHVLTNEASKYSKDQRANLKNFLTDLGPKGATVLSEGIRDNGISRDQLDMIADGKFSAENYSNWVGAGHPGG